MELSYLGILLSRENRQGGHCVLHSPEANALASNLRSHTCKQACRYASLDYNRIKNGGSIVKTVFLPLLYTILEVLRLKTCGFLHLIKVFYSISVSSLGVGVYASRSSAENFCSKSVRPTVLFSLRIRFTYYSCFIFSHFALILLNS